MKSNYFIFFSLLLTMFFTNCKKEKTLPETIDYSYFPLNLNHEVEYKVTKIKIDAPINVYDTQIYYLKEKIDSFYFDETGNKTFRIELYKRYHNFSNWEITDAWMAQIVNNQAHKVEENIRYVKIVFPLKLQLKWDGNAHNTLEKQIYTVEKLHETWKQYDSTCLIVQQNKESLIDKYYQSERYAKHVGLVEKININISQAYIIQGLPIEQRIKRGEIYIQTTNF